MKRIDKRNKIFDSLDFLKDKYMFNIILMNLNSEILELYSDEENYIICRGAKNFPTWIWTKDGFDKSKISEIEDLIKMYLTDDKKNKFTCKKELYDLLVERNFEKLNLEDYFEMGFLICNETKKPKKCDGSFSIASRDDIEVLAQFFVDDYNEMCFGDTLEYEIAKRAIEGYVDEGMFYVLKNPIGKIVSMAGYGLVDNQAKIKNVYTPVEERKKGYAANLIYYLTNELLEKGYVPLLYTDYNYKPSNKAYINAGYEDGGILINFTCSKNNQRRN